MVRVWPFRCLHIGSLNTRESYYDILEAMIDGLQILPAQNSSSWGPKLRILDLRCDVDCETICSEIGTTFPFCFQSCIYSQHSILKIEEAQHRVTCLGIGNSRSEPQSAQEPMELLVDISLNSILRTEQFLSFLCGKIQQNVGSLHVCCRDLQIDRMSGHKSILQFLDLDQLHKLLRVVPPQLDSLYLPHCHLSHRDITVLSQSSQATHLRVLSLSNNHIFSEVYEPFQTLLE
ncbi:hypothetical protein EI555_002908, partial [Monodon monoceros]